MGICNIDLNNVFRRYKTVYWTMDSSFHKRNGVRVFFGPWVWVKLTLEKNVAPRPKAFNDVRAKLKARRADEGRV